MKKRNRKKKLTISKKMIDDIQGRTDMPAVLKKNANDINCLKNRKWVEEIEL